MNYYLGRVLVKRGAGCELPTSWRVDEIARTSTCTIAKELPKVYQSLKCKEVLNNELTRLSNIDSLYKWAVVILKRDAVI